METKQRAALGLMAAALMCALWGSASGGFRRFFPEDARSTSPVSQQVQEEEAFLSGEESGVVKRYDAALHLRGKPLKDPFHVEGIMKGKAASEAIPSGNGASYQIQRRPPTEPTPVLKGVITAGNSRRAILEVQGRTVMAEEGGAAGSWTIAAIGERTATLARGGEAKIISVR